MIVYYDNQISHGYGGDMAGHRFYTLCGCSILGLMMGSFNITVLLLVYLLIEIFVHTYDFSLEFKRTTGFIIFQCTSSVPYSGIYV